MPVARRGEGLRVLGAGPAQPDDDLIRARACRRLAGDGGRLRLRDSDRRCWGWGLRLDDSVRGLTVGAAAGWLGRLPHPARARAAIAVAALMVIMVLFMGVVRLPHHQVTAGSMRGVGPNVNDHQDLGPPPLSAITGSWHGSGTAAKYSNRGVQTRSRTTGSSRSGLGRSDGPWLCRQFASGRRPQTGQTPG